MHNFRLLCRNISFSLLPSQCLLCASSLSTGLLCDQCLHHLPHSFGMNLCEQCGLELQTLDRFCGHCLHHPPAFSRSLIPFSYQHPVDHLIHQFKYRRNLACGKCLGELFADYLSYQAQEQQDWREPDLIIPVPMHWLRRWQRGFNHAEILGSYVARELKIPMATRIIQRTQRTPAQRGLSRLERQQNMRKAFHIKLNNRDAIKNKHIALIDDVVTTTATVRALSHCLLKAGAREVQIWALARTH